MDYIWRSQVVNQTLYVLVTKYTYNNSMDVEW